MGNLGLKVWKDSRLWSGSWETLMQNEQGLKVQFAFPQNMLVGQKHDKSSLFFELQIFATIIRRDNHGSTVSDIGSIWQYIAIY